MLISGITREPQMMSHRSMLQPSKPHESHQSPWQANRLNYVGLVDLLAQGKETVNIVIVIQLVHTIYLNCNVLKLFNHLVSTHEQESPAPITLLFEQCSKNGENAINNQRTNDDSTRPVNSLVCCTYLLSAVNVSILQRRLNVIDQNS